MPTHLKVFIYKTAIRFTLTYGNETWPVTGALVDKVNSCEMRMLRYCLEKRGWNGMAMCAGASKMKISGEYMK